jgi:glutaredoxin
LDENENNQESPDVGTAQNNMESIDTEIGTNANQNVQGSPNVMLNQNNIVGVRGLRKPIEELDVNIRDVVSKEYLLLGPCQPKGRIFLKKQIGDRQRSFQKSWFKKHEWFEYSVAKDAVFCFYCFLFKQPRRENFGVESYTGATEYNNWKNAIKSFDENADNIDGAHNKARRCCDDFKNQIKCSTCNVTSKKQFE